MNDVLTELHDSVLLLTLNRVSKHNAFDDRLLLQLQQHIDDAENDPKVRVLVIKANGRHFSAGADIAWMQRMVLLSEEENIHDAKILARLMYSLHHCLKPTIAMVHGHAIGGGAGLVAACDVAIAAETARFCFSEVTLGLIPAVISPYVIKAMGARTAAALFMSAETFDAKRAYETHLVQHCVPDEELLTFTMNHANQMAKWPPRAVSAAKSLVLHINDLPLNDELVQITATLIAKQRVSEEGQLGLKAFLNKGQHVS
ncbi:MAG: enoyl-CoA hydratase-related protein [Legionellales bacterium]|nr:enoyl-CoA hydratase-related protein [Legionellales bacterium]